VAGNFYKLADRVYFAACRKPSVGIQPSREQYSCYTVDFVKYYPFCDDFGPYNLACVLRFNDFLKRRLEEDELDHVFCCSPDRQSRTNAVFLLGAFLVLERGMTGADVMEPLSHIQPFPFEPFRDATFGQSSFSLNLVDCWNGLAKGAKLGWLEPRYFELEEYEHYDDPGNGDLHMIVPDKLIAFKGPTGNLPFKREWFDKAGVRHFDPRFYVPIFQDINVSVVVRLNDEEYDKGLFIDAGISHADLYFDDCTVPPPKVVVKFLQIVERSEGTVAVHCKAGLGRTGTLIALYLMKHYEFTAREAMGWLRVLRPGSVIGKQQQFLVDQEPTMARARERSLSGGSPGPPLTQPELTALSITADDPGERSTADAESETQAKEVAEGMARKSNLRAQSQQQSDAQAATVASVAERIRTGDMDLARTSSSAGGEVMRAGSHASAAGMGVARRRSSTGTGGGDSRATSAAGPMPPQGAAGDE